ncbi:hypothetical protein [Dyella lutea]|uniref:Uncharacterized protein n=1 Tax=Dyella lutea TaxID=2950441 RepID=A0ABT1FHW7_9GAMM|nr:hypothetical protein [Dyella lutea]MCP1376018.1 hypothetical protein [Dyella lutea]
MRRTPVREDVKGMLKTTDYCGRHNRRYRVWALLGGKLVARRCPECEQADADAIARARDEAARRG